jgi:hypothetical protein
MDEMNCDELVERATDYLEGALSSTNLTRMGNHLRLCWGCERYLGGVNLTLQLVSKLPTEPLSDELERDLLQLYRRWSESVSP